MWLARHGHKITLTLLQENRKSLCDWTSGSRPADNKLTIAFRENDRTRPGYNSIIASQSSAATGVTFESVRLDLIFRTMLEERREQASSFE